MDELGRFERTFAAASILTAEHVVFNIKGNDYRPTAAVSYQAGLVLIEWLAFALKAVTPHPLARHRLRHF